MSDKSSKIKLNGSNNKSRFVVMAIGVLIIALFITSKIYLPDGRKNTTNFNEDTKISLAHVKFTIDDYSYNSIDQIGEIRLTETITNIDDKYKVNYSVFDSKNNELSYKVIESDLMRVEGQTHQRYVIIQYAVPRKYFNVTINMEQPNIQDTKIRIDYRDNRPSEIREKGDDFIKEYQDMIFDYKNYYDITIDDNIDEVKSIITVLNNKIDDTVQEEELEMYKKELSIKESELAELESVKNDETEEHRKLEVKYLEYLEK